MKTPVHTFDHEAAGEIELDDGVFGADVRRDILHRVVRWQLARRRSGNHQVLERNAVKGSTAKIWNQKGTGRARHGNRKAPQFRGGGVAFGPRVRDHSFKLPKKVRRLGLKIALSAKQAGGDLIVLDEAKLAEATTKSLKAKLEKFGSTKVLLIDGPELDANLELAARNLPGIRLLASQGANVYDILNCDKLALTRAAVEHLEARLK